MYENLAPVVFINQDTSCKAVAIMKEAMKSIVANSREILSIALKVKNRKTLCFFIVDSMVSDCMVSLWSENF